MRSQAIPMVVYRRRQLWGQARPVLLLALMVGVAYSVALLTVEPRARLAPIFAPSQALECTGAECGLGTVPRPELAPVPPPKPPLAAGRASTEGIGDAAIANIDIALLFIDGTVIEPGAALSFDDVARTWDFQEDERYLWGLATAVRGPISMRGGGVCWVSTALWRAALAAGLRTDWRQSHFGLVEPLGPGLDATNTLVIRNDSPLPVTVRAWRDDEAVYAALFADGSLDRTARLEGPVHLGRGVYAAYQHVVWDDGTEQVSEFSSRYYW